MGASGNEFANVDVQPPPASWTTPLPGELASLAQPSGERLAGQSRSWSRAEWAWARERGRRKATGCLPQKPTMAARGQCRAGLQRCVLSDDLDGAKEGGTRRGARAGASSLQSSQLQSRSTGKVAMSTGPLAPQSSQEVQALENAEL